MSKIKLDDKVYLECKVTDIDIPNNNYRLAFVDYEGEYSTVGWVDKEVLHPVNESYNQGLNDAWELARKIVLPTFHGGYTWDEVENIFGTKHICKNHISVLFNFTPQEALAKVKAYEEERNEIKVGDVVKVRGGFFESIVTKVDGRIIYRLFRDGGFNNVTKKEDLIKTGKHFDSIDEFMKS